LAGCLSELIQAVKNLLEKSRNATPMIEFRASAGVYCLSMADSTANAVNWFLLVQKPSVQLSIDMSSVKLAALPRLSNIHKYFLPGVGLRKVDRPIFQHYFGPEIDMYEIMKGEEWTQSINDRSLAFLQEKRFEGLRFFLYWSQV
jgi:type VI secretion system protein ImpJ